MIFVTGATGYLGRNLIKSLAQRGKSIRALVHSEGKINCVKEYCTDIIVGDINDEKIILQGLKDIEFVIHLAAVIKTSNVALYDKVNVQGTENLCKCCIKSNIKSIIYVSSGQAQENFNSHYGISKRKAEEIMKNSGLKWTIIRPVLIFGGDGDRDLTRLIQFVRKYSVVPILGRGNSLIQPIYITDVINAIYAMLEFNKNIIEHKIYELAGKDVITLTDFIILTSRLIGRYRFRLHIPIRFLQPLVFIYERIVNTPLLDSNMLKSIEIDKIANIDLSVKELGFNPISLIEGIRKTLSYHPSIQPNRLKSFTQQ